MGTFWLWFRVLAIGCLGKAADCPMWIRSCAVLGFGNRLWKTCCRRRCVWIPVSGRLWVWTWPAFWGLPGRLSQRLYHQILLVSSPLGGKFTQSLPIWSCRRCPAWRSWVQTFWLQSPRSEVGLCWFDTQVGHFSRAPDPDLTSRPIYPVFRYSISSYKNLYPHQTDVWLYFPIRTEVSHYNLPQNSYTLWASSTSIYWYPLGSS